MKIQEVIDDIFVKVEDKVKQPIVKQAVVYIHALVDDYIDKTPAIDTLDVKTVLKQAFDYIASKTSNLTVKFALGIVEQLVESLIPA